MQSFRLLPVIVNLIRIYGSRQKDVKESYSVVDTDIFQSTCCDYLTHKTVFESLTSFQQIFLDGISPGSHEVRGINSLYLQQNKEINTSCRYDYIMVHIALFHSIH